MEDMQCNQDMHHQHEIEMQQVCLADKNIMEFLQELRQLKEEIKVLEEREKAVKQSIIDKSLGAETICNNEGLILATYKTQIRQAFNLSLFKKVEQETYDRYLESKEIKQFLLKEYL